MNFLALWHFSSLGPHILFLIQLSAVIYYQPLVARGHIRSGANFFARIAQSIINNRLYQLTRLITIGDIIQIIFSLFGRGPIVQESVRQYFDQVEMDLFYSRVKALFCKHSIQN